MALFGLAGEALWKYEPGNTEVEWVHHPTGKEAYVHVYDEDLGAYSHVIMRSMPNDDAEKLENHGKAGKTALLRYDDIDFRNTPDKHCESQFRSVTYHN